MEQAIWTPDYLEIRQSGGRAPRLAGSFPYNKAATIAKAGRVRKERVAPGAFAFAINDPARDINLLWGHKFDYPLASKAKGTLTIRDTPKALVFEAELPPIDIAPSWIEDAVRSVRSGLVGGISPGFTLPPAGAVALAERFIPEEGNPDVHIREILDAILIELSLVTRPVYRETTVEARAKAERNPQPPIWI